MTTIYENFDNAEHWSGGSATVYQFTDGELVTNFQSNTYSELTRNFGASLMQNARYCALDFTIYALDGSESVMLYLFDERFIFFKDPAFGRFRGVASSIYVPQIGIPYRYELRINESGDFEERLYNSDTGEEYFSAAGNNSFTSSGDVFFRNKGASNEISGTVIHFDNLVISDQTTPESPYESVDDDLDTIDIETAVFHADQYKLSETISFQTAINRAESGAEYRTALYPYPDRVWQFTASNDQLSMFNLQQERLSDWYVPAMQLAEAIDVAQGATNVPFDHFGYVYLTNGTNNQLTTISGNTLADAATHDFTHVAPAYVGKLIENPVMSHNALYARDSVQFRMQIYDDLEFTPAYTYQGDEVFTECTLLQGMSTTEYSQEIGVNATINNYFDIHAETPNTQFKRPIKLLYYRKQLKSRYSWLFDKQGRYKPFWYPSFGNEFTGFSVAGQVITTPKTHVPKHVAIEKEGAWTFYAVTVNELESTLELTLDALPPAEPFNLYRLDHVRLDSDSVTIEHGYTFALDLTITELP
ncbi:MAG: hypothetical protein SVC26_07010 [Pseudomonadota bacterium]|nr:hypothetical protein [Pseudomonadota bacterium]